MTTALTLTTTDSEADGGRVLTASGEIDMSNADAFATALADAVESNERPLVVDLTAVEYLDSAGLSALFAHADHVRLVASPILAPVLTVVGLADITTVRSA
ncbi:STAS domain-containing protein [Micromonospora sp. NPDC047074]|uniref:STAS domain-containing protein n=1 Tax=Micromonospora sp. NPDC047074 TaxID=3154339 RepID=UPI0033C475B8